MQPSSPPEKSQPKAGLPPNQRKWLVPLAIVVAAIVVIGTSVFVLTLPPSLTISDGSVVGVLRTNLTAWPSATEPMLYLNATTYANQTDGRTSTLTLRIRAFAYFSGGDAPEESQFWAGLTVEGTFARNVHPGTLTLAANDTGPYLMGQALAAAEAVNISTGGYSGFSFSDNAMGSVAMPLVDQSGTGPTHDFRYVDEVVALISPAYDRFVGFRVTVTGWYLPAIGVGVLVHLVNAP